MDVKVSNIAPVFINEIDRKAADIAKKQGSKFSRNDYIKMLIEHDTMLRLDDIKQDKFDRALENIKDVLEKQTASIQEYINTNNRLLQSVLSQSIIDLSEEVDE